MLRSFPSRMMRPAPCASCVSWATTLKVVAFCVAAEESKEALRRLPGGPSTPLTIHLRQEVDRLNKVLRVAADTLRTLRLAVAGTVALG